MADDHKDYDKDDHREEDCQLHFPSASCKGQVPGQKAKGSVQAHKISSHARKEPLSVREKKEVVWVLEENNAKEQGPTKRRHLELENNSTSDEDSSKKKVVKLKGEQVESTWQDSSTVSPLCTMEDFRDPQRWKELAKQGKMPHYFDLIEENVYLTERKNKKSHRDMKHMVCQCPPLSEEQRAQGKVACGECCLNRLLMIQCSSRCPNGSYCSNRHFQKKQHADIEVILTEKKGWGLRAAKDLPADTFVMEYCGEVLDDKEFKARVREYARNKNSHHYFMAVKKNQIIDATRKGNCARFMNHSCQPNCQAQKWIVNGELRVGFFTTQAVPSGTELTFDYHFQQYGKEAQKCFCNSAKCQGYLGGKKLVSFRSDGRKMEKVHSRTKRSVDRELKALQKEGEADSGENQGLRLAWLMSRIKTPEQKLTCLKIIQSMHSQSYLKSLLKYDGLSLLWLWMVELGHGQENAAEELKLKLEIIKTLELLPIHSTNKLKESKVLPVLERWAQTKESQSETDKILDVTNLATRLLSRWKELKEVYRIPKKRQPVKENSGNHGRETVRHRDRSPAPRNPIRSTRQDTERQSRRRRWRHSSPLPSGYERGAKRPADRYDTPARWKKKVRVKHRNRLSLEERRKLFEQEFAQREAQKQQQKLQSREMTHTLPYDSMGYGTPDSSCIGYLPAYSMQAYIDPSNPSAGKMLLPLPTMDSTCLPAAYKHPQTLVQRQTYGLWDCSQQTVAIQQQSVPAQSQPDLHYQAQTSYGVTYPCLQMTPLTAESYIQPGLQYIQGQHTYSDHPQGVTAQPPTALTATITDGQTQPIQQPEVEVSNNLLNLPPPAPLKTTPIDLSPNWKTGRDIDGSIYYYHVKTWQIRWDPPTCDSMGDDSSLQHQAEMDPGTSTYNKSPTKSSKQFMVAEVDSHTELANKNVQVFKKQISQFIVQRLNPYCKPDCKVGRITTTKDFKYLARKLTYTVLNEELKYCKNPNHLQCNENVKCKAKEYIKKYMLQFGAIYKPKQNTDQQ